MPGEQVGSAYAKISLDKSDFDSGLDSAHGKFSSVLGSMEGKAASVGKTIGSALVVGTVAAGAALAGVATVGVKSYMDIESAAADAASKMDLGEIAQKSGKTIEESFDSVKGHVIDLSRELGQLNTNAFDPTQIADALAGLAAGGFDVATASAKDLTPILSLATATNYGLRESADLSTATLAQFGLGMEDLGRVADVYTLAAGKSKAGMQDFDYAMQQAGPVAKGVGMSFEELVARVSKLADAGYKGEKAGTALRTAMMALTSPTKTQMEVFKRLGITFDQVNPKQHSFSETLDLLISKGADIYDFGEIYGKEGAAIVYTTAQQSAAVKTLTVDLEKSQGAAERMAKMMLDTLGGSFDAAKGAAIDLAIGIGEKLAPKLKEVFEWFSASGAPAIRAFIDALSSGDWSKVGEIIKSAIDAGLAKAKSLISQFGSWIGAQPWAQWFARAGEAIINQPWGSWASQAIDLLGRGMQAAISAALKIGDWIHDKLQGWISAGGPRKLGQSIADAIVSFFKQDTSISDQMQQVWGTVTEWAGIGWQIVKGVGQGLLDRMYVAVQPAANRLLASFATASYEIQGTFARSWNTILIGAANLVDGIVSAFTGIGTKISGYLQPAIDKINEVTAKVNSITSTGAGTSGKWVSETGAVLPSEAAAMKYKADKLALGEMVSVAPYTSGGRDYYSSAVVAASGGREDAFSYGTEADSDIVPTFAGYRTGGKGFVSSELVSSTSGDRLYMITDKGDFVTLTGKETVAKSVFDLISPYTADYVTNSALAGQAWADKVMPVGEEIVSSQKDASATQKEAAKVMGAALKEDAKTSGGYWANAGKDLQSVINYASQTAWGSITKAAGVVDQAAATSANTLTAAAQNSLTIGNAIASKMQGAGDAVKIGLDAAGRQIAVIGQVAQSQFAAAGGQFVGSANQAGTITTGAATRASGLIQGVTSGFSQAGSTVSSGLNAGANALQGAAGAVTSAANAMKSGSDWVRNLGTTYQTTGTTKGKTATSKPTWMTDAVPWLADGKETSGPELAVIGEDGKEFVIPTKTKRWDLLLAAMKAYGIRGMADGGAAGTGGASSGEADQMQAYFGITGLASMSKSVQKIISDLKDFFRISWSIIKAEGSTYWKAINAIITTEATTTRNNAWQAALDIRNTWLSSNQRIVADATATYAAMWPAIEPGVKSIHDGIIYSFQDSGSQVKALMDQMGSDAMISLTSFQTSWNTVWQQMLADLQSTASQITGILTDLGAKVGSITVNASVNVAGGGAGSYGGSADMTGSGGGGGGGGSSNGAIINANGTANFQDTTCLGDVVLVNALKYTNPNGQVSYINPLTYIETGGISNYQGGGSSSGSSSYGGSGSIFSGYGTNPWAAKGALIDEPQRVIVGEKGPELILPAKLTRMFLNLAEGGSSGPGEARPIVIEDHTSHHWYLDGKEVTNQIMKSATKQLRLKGAIATR